jgi:hypothetical protein
MAAQTTVDQPGLQSSWRGAGIQPPIVSLAGLATPTMQPTQPSSPHALADSILLPDLYAIRSHHTRLSQQTISHRHSILLDCDCELSTVNSRVAGTSRLPTRVVAIWWLPPSFPPSNLAFMSPISANLPPSRRTSWREFRHLRQCRQSSPFPQFLLSLCTSSLRHSVTPSLLHSVTHSLPTPIASRTTKQPLKSAVCTN